MKNNRKIPFSDLRVKYRFALVAPLFAGVAFSIIPTVSLSFAAASAMGIQREEHLLVHPNGKLWLATLFAYLTSLSTIGFYTAMNIITAALAISNKLSWKDAREAINTDHFPTHWYKDGTGWNKDAPAESEKDGKPNNKGRSNDRAEPGL